MVMGEHPTQMKGTPISGNYADWGIGILGIRAHSSEVQFEYSCKLILQSYSSCEHIQEFLALLSAPRQQSKEAARSTQLFVGVAKVVV